LKTKIQKYNSGIINVKGIGIGLLISYIITLSAFVIYAFLLTYTSLSEFSLPTMTMLVTIIGVVIAGAFSTKNTKSKGWLNGGIAGLLYITVMFVFGILFIKELGPSSSWLIKYLWGGFLGSLGGMIGINL